MCVPGAAAAALQLAHSSRNRGRNDQKHRTSNNFSENKKVDRHHWALALEAAAAEAAVIFFSE